MLTTKLFSNIELSEQTLIYNTGSRYKHHKMQKLHSCQHYIVYKDSFGFIDPKK